MKPNGHLKVEKGIPLPPDGRGGGRGYQVVLRTLTVGQSVVLPTKTYANAWTAAATAIGKGKFVVRKAEHGGFRVWRTK